METNQTTTTHMQTTAETAGRDEILWSIARKRASFKWSALSYVMVNSMLVAIWLLTSGLGSYFWPVWPILGWGVGVAMHYYEAYHGHQLFSTQKEYEKLKEQYKN